MNTKHEPSEQSWGTLEELLLACAVNRHGTKSWDSIAIEVQNRCSGSPSLLTPQDCRDRFNDLKRRFMARNDDGFTGLVFLIDELRKIRIEELRREVERRDVSIVSLELKVKRLEEERRHSLKEEGEEVTDLKGNRDEKTSETKPSIGNTAGKSVSGEDSDDRENRSINESNSMSPKNEAQQNPVEPTGNKSGSARTAFEPEREWSFNGKAEVEDDYLVLKQEEEERSERKASPAGGISDSNEALESLDESKREGKEGRLTSKRKQRNEVQKSTANLSRKKRRREVGNRANGERGSGGDEPEGDEVSPATKRESDAKFEPLINFLEIVRSHQLGSVFECRLRSQESEHYENLVRKHMDLQTIRSRLDKGVYSDSVHPFFRDLLLLFINAITFFHKNSPEYNAAHELRALVLKEMRDKLQRAHPVPVKPELKQGPESLSKPTKSSPLVVCGKRGGSVKVLSELGNRELLEAKEREVEDEEKVVSNGSLGTKKKNKEVLASGSRSSGTKKNGEMKHVAYGGNELSSHDAVEVIEIEKKESLGKKRQGAASFLKRMKQNSASEVTDEVEDDGEVSDEDSRNGGRENNESKGRGRKKNGSTERVTKSCNSNGGRRGREANDKAKRGVGRPAKRSETVGTGVGNGGRSRKRSRKR